MQFDEENSQHLKDWIIKRLENMYVRHICYDIQELERALSRLAILLCRTAWATLRSTRLTYLQLRC